jgi:hypothetical protein
MYRKNTAGQFIALAAVNATTGAALSGATISGRRCLDGTFAAIGATITEDTGLGFYKVALAQADTNGNNCEFFFTATNMVPVCINIVTTAADPTDSVRFGLTALPNAAAGGAAGIPVVGTGTNNFKSDASANVTFANTSIATVTTVTNQLTAAQIATGVWTDTTAGDFTTALSIGKSIMNGVALGTGLTVNDITTKTGYSLSGTQTFNVTGNITGNLSGSVGSVTGAVGSVTGAVGSVTAGVTVTTNNDKTGYALTSAEENAIADAILGRNVSGGSSTGRTVKQALHFIRNKWVVSSGVLTVYDTDDTTPSWTGAVTGTPGADPITANDPA